MTKEYEKEPLVLSVYKGGGRVLLGYQRQSAVGTGEYAGLTQCIGPDGKMRDPEVLLRSLNHALHAMGYEDFAVSSEEIVRLLSEAMKPKE